MPRIAFALGLSFLVTTVFIFALRPVAVAIGLVDHPGGRKNHVGDIPIIGGLAMFPGLALAAAQAFPTFEQYAYFFSALGLLIVVGAVDDRFDLPASVRLLAQTCAVLIMMLGSDIQVQTLGALFSGSPLELNGFSGVFTVLIALTAINAFNMFDGSDGIAGIQAVVALVLLGGLCLMVGALQPLFLIAGGVGCLLAFLGFNWPSQHTASIRCFMGDAGSTMLGFLLAWLSIYASQGPVIVISPVAALWIFSLPLFDFFSSMIRRMVAGRSPFHGDSEHLHHQLRRLGLSPRRIAQLILCGSGVFGLIGVSAFAYRLPDGVMLVIWLVVGSIYHIVFGTTLLFPREATDEASQSGAYPSIWRPRRGPEPATIDLAEVRRDTQHSPSPVELGEIRRESQRAPSSRAH